MRGDTFEIRPDCSPGRREVVAVLEIEPELRLDSKIAAEPQRAEGCAQPRPTKGIWFAITVRNRMFASSGSESM
jgi:hypothetical protein